MRQCESGEYDSESFKGDSHSRKGRMSGYRVEDDWLELGEVLEVKPLSHRRGFLVGRRYAFRYLEVDNVGAVGASLESEVYR